jgi:membrane protein
MRPPRSASATIGGVKPRVPPLVLTSWPIEVARDWVHRFVAVQGVDRAMAIGAQAYTALIPLLIVYAALLPRSDSEDFADAMIKEFELRGSTAASFKRAFAPAGEVESSVTALGVLLLVVSALSFTRGMQRLYEGVYDLDKLGMRNTPRALLWLAVVTVFLAVRPIVLDPLEGWVNVAATLTLSVLLWLLTPYLMLGRRVSWQRLLPGAVLSSIGMAGVGVWSVLWMPHLLASSAGQFGVIGIGFALLTWLIATAGVIVVTTTGGALIADRWSRARGAPTPISRPGSPESPSPVR